jgi:hypothetical protein
MYPFIMQQNSFTQKISSLVLRNKNVQRATLVGAGVLATIGGASAGEVINTTAITGLFSDLTIIFPSMGNLVVAVLPTIMLLAVIGFALGFFDKILGIFDKVV